jgi:hypothetical protein
MFLLRVMSLLALRRTHKLKSSFLFLTQSKNSPLCEFFYEIFCKRIVENILTE